MQEEDGSRAAGSRWRGGASRGQRSRQPGFVRGLTADWGWGHSRVLVLVVALNAAQRHAQRLCGWKRGGAGGAAA